MSTNASIAQTLADHLVLLGGISADRVHTNPTPGTATFDDWVAANGRGVRCELVDATLVDKPMGFYESLLASVLIARLIAAAEHGKLGVTSGEQGFIRLGETQVRSPDVGFFLRSSLPGGKLPSDSVPAICPEIAVEILSPSNTVAEMTLKRKEYFQGGCRLVWMVDPNARNVAIYEPASALRIAAWDDELTAPDILPAFRLKVCDLFNEVDGQID